jgi:mono/diheme cytochrome c family protein
MRNVCRLSVSLLVLLALLTLTMSFALAAPPAQDPENGQTLWEQNLCKNCHGEAGEGKWGAPLAGSEKTAEEWISQVRSPRNRMPHFSPVQVSDEMVIDMHAYLTTLTAPESFAPADAGLPADAPAGQQLLVEKRCVACHGTTGPIQPFEVRGETPTAEAVITQLRTPRENMPMFAVEQVSDDEAALIAEFLASEVTVDALPETGSSASSTLLVVLLLSGGALLLTGLGFRRLKASS